jgi:hypothetical protein
MGGCGQVTGDNPDEIYEVVRGEPDPILSQAKNIPFLITAGELRDRKTKRRRKHESEVISGLVELGLKKNEVTTASSLAHDRQGD